MATLVQGGEAAAASLMYGEPHPNTMQFFQNQVQSASSNLTEAGQNFMDRARTLFDSFSNSDSLRLARAARRAVNSIWDDDSIRQLVDIGQMQWSGPTMQRWIMASPFVRERYHNQTLEGYDGSYVDNAENDIGEDHYDYRRVTNGILMETETGDYEATTYFEDIYNGDRELEFDEQVDILMTWHNVKQKILEGKEDPTSRFNASL